jgi:hypothetical protein
MNDKPLRTIVDVNKSLKVFAGSLRKIHISILESFSYDKMSIKKLSILDNHESKIVSAILLMRYNQ